MFKTIDFIVIILVIIIAFTFIVNYNENFNQLICTSNNTVLNSNTEFAKRINEYCNPPFEGSGNRESKSVERNKFTFTNEQLNNFINMYKSETFNMLQSLKSMTGYTHVEVKNNPFRKSEIFIEYLDTNLREKILSINNNLKIISEKEVLRKNYDKFIQNLNEIMLEIDNDYDYSFQDYNLDQIIQHIRNKSQNTIEFSENKSIYDESVITFLENVKNNNFNNFEPISYNLNERKVMDVRIKQTKLLLEFQKILFGIITNGNNNITFGINTPVFYILFDLLLKGYTAYKNMTSHSENPIMNIFFKQTYSEFLNEIENFDSQIEQLKTDILNKISSADNQLTKNNNLKFMIFNILKLLNPIPIDNNNYQSNINYLKQLYDTGSEFQNFENLDNNTKIKYIKITEENLFDLHIIHSFNDITWDLYNSKLQQATNKNKAVGSEKDFNNVKTILINLFNDYFSNITDIHSDNIKFETKLNYENFNGSLSQMVQNNINGSLYYLFKCFGVNLNPIIQNTSLTFEEKESLKSFYMSLFYIYLEVPEYGTSFFDNFLNFSSTLELLHTQQKNISINEKINNIKNSNYTYENIKQDNEISEVIEEKLNNIFNYGKSLLNSNSEYSRSVNNQYVENIIIDLNKLNPNANQTIDTEIISDFQGSSGNDYEGVYKGLDINSNNLDTDYNTVRKIIDFFYNMNDDLTNVQKRYLSSPRLVPIVNNRNIFNSDIQTTDGMSMSIGFILLILLIINLLYGIDEEDPAYNFSIKEIVCFNSYGVLRHLLQGIKNLNLSLIYQGTVMESVSETIDNLKDDIVSVLNIFLDSLCNSNINNNSELVLKNSERINRINQGVCNMRDEFSNLTFFNNSQSKYENCN